MKLNHLHLMVADVVEAAAFLEKYFGMRPASYHPKLILMMDGEMALTLMYAKEAVYPEFFHIGFIQINRWCVDQVHKSLIEGGYEVPAPTETNHGYTFYVKMPGGPTVEVLC